MSQNVCVEFVILTTQPLYTTMASLCGHIYSYWEVKNNFFRPVNWLRCWLYKTLYIVKICEFQIDSSGFKAIDGQDVDDWYSSPGCGLYFHSDSS